MTNDSKERARKTRLFKNNLEGEILFFQIPLFGRRRILKAEGEKREGSEEERGELGL